MHRRGLLAPAGTMAPWPGLGASCAPPPPPVTGSAGPFRRVRPSDPAWPSSESWAELDRQVSGRLSTVQSPLLACVQSLESGPCVELGKHLTNPYYLGDEVGLTQSLGWVDAGPAEPPVSAG